MLARIAAACDRAGRDPSAVRLIAVSKTVPAERLRAAIAAGVETFGENRVQEGEAKRPLVPRASWHLIGPLQSNKARRALAAFDVIQSVDTVDLAERLDRLAQEDDRASADAPYPVLLQVNVDDDPAKAGFQPEDVGAALDRVAGLPALRVDGLMTVGRLVADPAGARPTFAALRTLAADLRRAGAPLGAELSMGMSDDFELAIDEGATIVRVGRALFGERVHRHADGPTEHTHDG